MDEITKIYEFDDWQLLVEELNGMSRKKNFIYRGQSNSYDYINSKFSRWDTISSFNRYYPYDKYNFRTFISQQLSDGLFTSVYSGYGYEQIDKLAECSKLERIYFLQHYGIPTCFMDFTFDPIIALYFSITDVRGDSGGSYDSFTGRPKFYPDSCYVSIFALDYRVLLDDLEVKKIEALNLATDHFNYQKHYSYLGLDLNPTINITSTIDNYNLEKQKGCFLLYDNDGNNKCLSWLLNHLIYLKMKEYKAYNLQKPLIHEFRLNYNSLFKPHKVNERSDSLFSYLTRENKTGRNLFNDLQGLKYDMNFFHN